MIQRFTTTVSHIWKQSANVLYKASSLDTGKSKGTHKVNDHSFSRVRYLIKTLTASMEPIDTGTDSIFVPPTNVRGMTDLQRDAFSATVMIPGFVLPRKEISKTQKLWKSHQLRRRGIKPIAELGDSNPLRETHSLVLLDPDRLKLKPFPQEVQTKLGFDSSGIQEYPITFTYGNWSVPEIMRAVLPTDAENVSSFTQIGHIAHLNLREENLPYKSLIGQVILDKISSVKTVVNKLNAIDNTFRNFQMELLAGELNYITQVREHGCTFEMDFSKVYWNSRLSSEHNRLVESTERGSTVFDVFAGIGPFAVPLAKKKKCTVYANDLNPASYESLKRNTELNKICSSGLLHSYNMDGREFIKTVMKDKLTTAIVKALETSEDESGTCRTDHSEKATADNGDGELVKGNNNFKSGHPMKEKESAIFVIMNLPGLAIEFLDAFNSLLQDLPHTVTDSETFSSLLPTVHCYTFEQRSETMEEEVRKRAEAALGFSFPSEVPVSVRLVRNVAPKKEMLCLSFKMWPELVLGHKQNATTKDEGEKVSADPPDCKRQKLSS